ncbi:hypothetical protein D5085_08165 [Ectothiorhodospiraceae bacterium BW-2]|nr:hypothetical protein D5085_08165 [Ectothiorhodospiraceae bacterium BW-2]
MFSKCLGKFPLDIDNLYADLAQLHESDYIPAYSEYTIGSWRTAILMNQEGDSSSGEVIEYAGSAQATPLAKKLPHIMQVLSETFNMATIKLARIATIKKYGLILPHIDFVTFSKPCKRYNIALISNDRCISIEEQTAYSMRSGEIWDLDATHPHSAANFSDEDRVSLIIDLEPIDNEKDYFNHPDKLAAAEPIRFIEREPLPAELKEHYLALAALMTRHNYRDILAMVAKLPFLWQMELTDVFEITQQICHRSGDRLLIDNIAKTKHAFLHERATDPVSGIL